MINSNIELAAFLGEFAARLRETDASQFDTLTVLAHVAGEHKLIAVTARPDGTIDNLHEPLHSFLHHTDFYPLGCYTVIDYEECPDAPGSHLQQDQRSGMGENHRPRHRATTQPR